jgi:uridine kinase
VNTPILIGIAGGSGSGKTTLAERIRQRLLPSEMTLLEEDSYYRNFPGTTLEERRTYNYDHPDAFDHDLLIHHLRALLADEAVEKPTYSFITYERLPETVHLEPTPVILLEGIMILVDPGLRNLMGIKVFVDNDPDVRFIRRLLRDVVERGRMMDSVIKQYLEVVRPMHLQFIEPSKRYADIIIPGGGHNEVAVDLIVSRLRR